VADDKAIEVAVIGGGCAAITAAFELTRPEHNGKYAVTVYQQGWRLGGKGASGRGAFDRIEEHGLHIWLGFYENAFRLMRDCYRELDRDPKLCPIAGWRDAFFPAPHVGMADIGRDGRWLRWSAFFPPADGLPGDPLSESNPFTMTGYLVRTAGLLRTLLLSVQTGVEQSEPAASLAVEDAIGGANSGPLLSIATIRKFRRRLEKLISLGVLGVVTALLEVVALLEILFRALPENSENAVVRLLEACAAAARSQLEKLAARDDESRYIWEIIDLVLAIMVGIFRFRLITDERGFDAIDEYECRAWLKANGASDISIDSAFVRGLFDLAMAYEDGDVNRPGLAAGQAIRGSLRMFFTYRGSLFWKMRAGMGDIVFAPFYEVLKRRGVKFRFFHRLEQVRLAPEAEHAPGEKPYVTALEFDVQARIRSGGGADEPGEYLPLVDVRGLPCWPSAPDYAQLVDGDDMRAAGWEFESFWDRNRVGRTTLHVGEDFDFVVLGVGIGAIPYLCQEILDRDKRWRDMVQYVKCVPSQAFQVWMHKDMKQLGWHEPAITLSAFVKPFDTWADMDHLIDQESWQPEPGAIAYFCSVLSDGPIDRTDRDYPRRRREEVRANAIHFLDHEIGRLWPLAAGEDGGFDWRLLHTGTGMPADDKPIGESAFDTQFWTANVNPSDRYTLALPGSLKYRISPLDNSYDNLTITGDWTDCSFNEGCVEAAVMSGRLAAHALSGYPALEDIIGYDHP